MRRAQMPFFSFYPDDFEAGTSRFTITEVGGYVRLLNAQWAGGGIPDNQEELARIMRCTKATAKTVWLHVKDKFVKGDDGKWRNPRLERERIAALRRKEKGRAAAGARWTDPDKQCSDDAQTMLGASTEHCLDDATEKEKEKEIPPTPPKGDALRGRFAAFWSEYPRKKAKGAAWRIWQRLKPSPGLTHEMLTAIRQQRSSREWREGFIPNPATWLNQERWTDEAETTTEAAPPIPFWDECAKCGDIHPVGQPCPIRPEAKS